MNAAMYRDILDENLLQSVLDLRLASGPNQAFTASSPDVLNFVPISLTSLEACVVAASCCVWMCVFQLNGRNCGD